MARFVFELEAVLELREREEDAARREVAAIERERVDLEGRLRAVREGIERERDEVRRGLAAGGVAIEDVRRQSTAAFALDARARDLVLQIAGTHARLSRARETLKAASARRKGVELLRDRRYEQWRRDLARAEASEQDELTVMRAGRTEDGT